MRQQEFREMQRLSGDAAPYHAHLLVKFEQQYEWREDADVSRAALVARRQAERARAGARQRSWERLQAAFRPARPLEPEPC
jgi:hypothetical protein